MKFLSEKTAPSEIRKLLRSTQKARIAVAFWGAGAVEQLELSRPGLQLEVLCNLDSGACNPSEIRRLQQAGIKVRSNPRLHGKVYWTPAAAVLGSSNASSNGLADEGLSGWAEANVLLTDAVVLRTINEWIEQQWLDGYDVTEDDLEAATDLWNWRASAAGSRGRVTRDLLAAFRSHPQHHAWEKVKVLFWTQDLTEGEQEDLLAFQREIGLRNYSAYGGWHEDFDAGDRVVEVDLSKKTPRFNGYWAVPNPRLESPGMLYVQQTGSVTLPGFPTLRLSRSDQDALLVLASTLVDRRGPGMVLSLADAAKHLEKQGEERQVRVSPTARQLAGFHRAMLDIYDQAKAIGYPASDFRVLVETRKGWGAAKYLLGKRDPSDGLKKLYLLGRPDLSVEALVQKPDWRGMFTEQELATAEARYPGLSRRTGR